MRKMKAIIVGLSLFTAMNLAAKTIDFEQADLEAVGVEMTLCEYGGKDAVKVIKNAHMDKPDEPTFVKLQDIDFKDGIIEVNILSKLVKNAKDFARGFIGLAFRINDDDSKFECIYLRPSNARANDQLRRNHTTQYFAYPDFDFFKSRKEAPGKYESYADMGLNEWIKVKIVIKDDNAQLFVNDAKNPCLIVNDLKHGKGDSGSIGLWVDTFTEGYFADLKVIEK